VEKDRGNPRAAGANSNQTPREILLGTFAEEKQEEQEEEGLFFLFFLSVLESPEN
jgi:hypothetical protein